MADTKTDEPAARPAPRGTIEDDVLGAAMSLLASEGQQAVTHLRVAEASGHARSSVYRLWPTRVDLLAATVATRTHDFPGQAVADLLERLPTGDALRQMLHLFCERMWTDRGGLAVLTTLQLAESDPSSPQALVHEAMVRRHVEVVASVIDAGVRRGDLPSGIDPHDAAASLFGPLLHYRFVLRSRPDEDQVDGIAESFLARFAA